MFRRTISADIYFFFSFFLECYTQAHSYRHKQIHTHIHTQMMSYSHLRGCWFSEMPQVRCHVHRSSGSKLRPLCLYFPGSPALPLIPICFATNTLSCDFIYANLSLQYLFITVLLLLLRELARLVSYFSLSVITERSSRY